jgi:Bacterial TniB protein
MTLDLSHLTAPTREQAFHDAKTRIRLVQTARWVGFPRAGVAVEELERRFHYPSCARMPCMLLYGDSVMGKTMILEKMERQHPNSYDERRGITMRPVLIIQMPASPDERRFYTRILEVLGAPYSVRDQIGALEGRVIHLLKQLGTQLQFIDEVYHLLAGSHREQRRALNLLKFLTNELKIVIVAVGTSDAFHALQTEVQVASRFEPLLIPRWTETDAFRAFIVAYGKLLPLRNALLQGGAQTGLLTSNARGGQGLTPYSAMY